MKILEPHYEILDFIPGRDGIDLMIERAARTCYKSKASEGSAKKIVNSLAKGMHTAMFEHAPIYLKWSLVTEDYDHDRYAKYKANPYSKAVIVDSMCYVTTNYRVVYENKWEDDLQYQCELTEYHERVVTIRFWMDRVGTQSVCRHRHHGFAQESTRFCNYSLGKFNDEITISQPHWIDSQMLQDVLDSEISRDTESKYSGVWAPNTNSAIKDIHMEYINRRCFGSDAATVFQPIYYWLAANEFCEFCYMKLIGCGLRAEDARGVLPLDLNSEIVVTGFVSDWMHFFDLRALDKTGPAHPDIHNIAVKVYNDFKERGYINV